MRFRFDAACRLLLAVGIMAGGLTADDKTTPDQKPADKPAEKSKKAKVEKKTGKGQVLRLQILNAPLERFLGGFFQEAPAVVNWPAAPNDAQIDAMTPQFIQQLRPIYKAELEFVRMLCSDLTVEQRVIVRTAADKALKQSARSLVEQQIRMNTGRGFNTTNPPNPIRTIREAVNKSVSQILTGDQLARFLAESTLRMADRKQSAVRGVVTRMDESLFLSLEQQEKITQSLIADWKDGWEVWLHMMQIYGRENFPELPDSAIIKHLTVEQVAVWRTIGKINPHWWWGGHQEAPADKDDWWGKEPEIVEKAAAIQVPLLIRTE